MKYSNFEIIDNSYSIDAHSKFLDFILFLETRRVKKKLIKHGYLGKNDKVNIKTNYKFLFEKVEANNG